MSTLASSAFAIRTLVRDVRGVAGMQFAFIAPLLVFLFLGVVAAFDATRAGRQAAMTAVTMSDLATRVIDMDDLQRDAFFNVSNALMSRWGDTSSTFSVSITSVINPVEDDPSDPEVTEEVAWSEASVAGYEIETGDLAQFDLPPIVEGASLILVEVRGSYIPKFAAMGLPTQIDMKRTSVRRPRFVSEVVYLDAQGNPVDDD